jgi:echinoid
MGYMENNYANSNNGGSLNSQDSLWQLKMGGGGGQQHQQEQQQQQQHHHQQQMLPGNTLSPHSYLDHQPTYGYDPMTHGGYGTIDDYAPYPHLTTITSTLPHDDAYHIMGNSDNRSRQELYCGDSYASVQKPKKPLDQHLGKLTYSSKNLLKNIDK